MPPKWPHYLGLAPISRICVCFLMSQSHPQVPNAVTKLKSLPAFCGHQTAQNLCYSQTPLAKKNSSAGMKFYINCSSACQHRSMGKDKVGQVGQVLVKTDFPVHSCYREKVREKFIHTESEKNVILAQPKNSVL